MRLPKMSTGAWIFATAALVLAVATPVSYAAVTSTVAIGNTTNSVTSFVDPERQLLIADGAQPSQVVHGDITSTNSACNVGYTPPAGKAIVVTEVTYNIGSPENGTALIRTELTDAKCSTVYDRAQTSPSPISQSHTFPTGLPMPSIGIVNLTGFSDTIQVTFTGYLIPATQLPPTSRTR